MESIGRSVRSGQIVGFVLTPALQDCVPLRVQVPVVLVIPVRSITRVYKAPDTLFRFVSTATAAIRCVCLCFFLNATCALAWLIRNFLRRVYCFQASRARARSCSCSVPAPARAPIGYRTDGGKIPTRIYIHIHSMNCDPLRA